MKRNNLEIDQRSFEFEAADKEEAHAAGLEPGSYARDLRALGQVLEEKRLSSIDLELRGGIYVVRGRVTPKQFARPSFIDFVRDLLRGAEAEPSGSRSKEQLDFRYTPEEIQRIDLQGKNRRKEANRMPDPYSLSQILRGAGSYLDHRFETELVGISIRDRWVTLRYKTAEGRVEQAKQDLEYFYDYWVKMYLRRSNRTHLPAASDPALTVSWEAPGKYRP